MPEQNDHYSYAEYAKSETAEGFEELRFGGPIGSFMRQRQQGQIERWIAEPKERRILDIGAGTGRTSIPLALAGARVTAADASEAMLEVARRNATKADAELEFTTCDAMHLPFADRSFDSVLCFRVLMHVTDWRAATAELCRVGGEEVILDFPPRWSLAALQVPVRSVMALFKKGVQNFRLFSLRQIRNELRRNGYEIVEVDRLWFLPIALHKSIGSLAFTKGIERIFTATGLRRLFGAPVTVRARRVEAPR